MQVAAGQWARSSEDITARARLRDAAIECFALRGFEASVREIASRAGVSAGLIRHHFGTKDALRAECDAEVLRRYRDLKVEGIRMSPAQTMGTLSQLDDFAPMFVYILRSVRDGGAAGREFIESMIAEAEAFSEDAVRDGVLKPSRDPAARARYLVTSSLGGLLVQLTLMPDLDLGDLPQAIRRLTDSIMLPTLELYTEGVLVDRSVLDEYLAHSPARQELRMPTSLNPDFERRKKNMTETLAVDVRGLQKNFGSVHALNGLDLRVATGSVAGFLGPNGSGKSTTIRILLGLLRADGGTATLLGGDPWRDAVELHRRVAYVAGDVTLWPNLTGGQAIDILGALRGDVDRARIDKYLQLFELDPTKKARSYSKGNRQKVALVAAFASRAELLILDEPTNGLDPLMEGVFTDCVSEAKDEGRSVLLSSHIFAEVEKLCDTVTIIRDGRTVESGTLTELRHLQRSTITVTIDGDPAALSAVDGVYELTADGSRVSFGVDEGALPRVMKALAPLGPRGLISTPPSLEELFLRHYGMHADDTASSAKATSR